MSDDIELLIDDPSDVQVETKREDKAAEPPKERQPPVDEGIAALRSQLAEAQRRASRSDQIAAEAIQKAQAAEAHAGNTQYQAITTALQQNQDRLGLLKQQLKEATSLGDADRVTDLTEALTDCKFNIRELEQGKAYIERQYEAQKHQRQQPRQPAAEADPTEGMTDAAKAWVKNNPTVLTDKSANDRMMAGHFLAVGEGLVEDTPEYFARIEETVYGRRKTETREEPAGRQADKAPEAPPRPQARYAAAPEKDGGPRRVQLTITKDMREAAEIAGMTIEEYAKQYVKTHGVK